MSSPEWQRSLFEPGFAWNPLSGVLQGLPTPFTPLCQTMMAMMTSVQIIDVSLAKLKEGVCVREVEAAIPGIGLVFPKG